VLSLCAMLLALMQLWVMSLMVSSGSYCRTLMMYPPV
jgi:hypothetical protein